MMLYLIWILVGLMGRLVVHIPDVTPLTSLCLLAPTVFSKRLSFALIAAILVLSDLCLHFIFHYPAFGLWSLFNYSGWFAVVLFGLLLAQKQTLLRAVSFTIVSSILFWIWTNVGTWCTTALYPHTLNGLMTCYIAALPFLRNAILGSVVWTSVLWICVSWSFFAKSLRTYFVRASDGFFK